MLPEDETGLSLRTAMDALSAGLILFGLLAGGGILLLVGQIGRTADELRSYDRSVQATQNLRLGLLLANREHFLERVEPGRGHDRLAAAQMAELDASLGEVRANVQTGEEARIVGQLDAEIRGIGAAFLDRSEPPVEHYRQISRLLDRTLGVADELLAVNRVQAEQAVARARNWQRGAIWGGAVLAAALVVLAVLLAFVARRAILRPVRGLQQAIARYGAGDREARAPRAGPTELRTIADQFAAMADALEAQRRQQLTFLAAVAHDLRNPLATLKTATQLMKRDVAALEPEEGGPSASRGLGRRVELLGQQLDRLGRMLDDLLDVSRVESGQLRLERRVGDLRETVREAAQLFAHASEKHTLEVSLPDEPVPVDYDPLRIDQVLVNLLSNAIKYAPGGGTIRVELRRVEGTARLAVTDPGLGIAPEEHERIFEPFHRGQAGRTEIPGTGLGLSATRRLVLAHEGTIEVESAPGQGSTFRVCLPLAE